MPFAHVQRRQRRGLFRGVHNLTLAGLQVEAQRTGDFQPCPRIGVQEAFNSGSIHIEISIMAAPRGEG